MNEPQHDIYRMAVEQNPEQEMTATEYAMLIAQAKADIRIDGLDLDTVAKFIVDAGWRPADYQPEAAKQTNAMCSAWADRAENAISQRTQATKINDTETLFEAAEVIAANSAEKFRDKFFKGQRTPATNFDWEITQAIIHLKNAASVTDSNRAHLLLSAVQIAKGVRESE